jgi:Gluconate 2-dehydrogenase subunit 3
MDKSSDSGILREASEVGGGLNRRQIVRRLLGGAGLASVAPLAAASHSTHKHMAGPKASPGAQTEAEKAKWKPLFFDPHQSATLEVLAERIVPGSTEARVMPFVDLLLSVDTQENQKKFLASLSAFDAESLRHYGHPYKDIAEAAQNHILTVASTAQPAATKNGTPEGASLRDHFENLKGWVSRAYYSSETGMKELGWTGQVFFTSFPGGACGGSGGSK